MSSIEIDAVGARHHHQTGRILVIGLVAQVLDHGQLFRAHLLGDLLDAPASGDTWYGKAVTTTLPSSIS